MNTNTSHGNDNTRLTKVTPVLKDLVADTLFIPLYMKARLTQENSPVIKDDSAVQLVDRIDYDFEKYKGATKSLIGCGVRADYFDQVCSKKIQQAMKSDSELIIISIGSGLDNRYARVQEEVMKFAHDYGDKQEQQLSGFVSFYEMDLEEVMALRTQILPARSNQYYLSGDLLKNDWLEKILKNHKFMGRPVEFLFLIEGVLMYFSQSQVKDFFQRMVTLFTDYHLPNQQQGNEQSNEQANPQLTSQQSRIQALMSSQLTEQQSRQQSEQQLRQQSNEKNTVARPTITFVFDGVSEFVVKMSDKHDAMKRTGTGVQFQWGMNNTHQLSQWYQGYQLQSVVNIMDLQAEHWDFSSKLWRLLPCLRHGSRIFVYRLVC